jgi:hypothetical protein
MSNMPAARAIRPAPQEPTLLLPADDRLPRPGSILTRRYKGRTLQVEVLEHGFAYAGQVYRSLSAVAKAVPGFRGRAAGTRVTLSLRTLCSARRSGRDSCPRKLARMNLGGQDRPYEFRCSFNQRQAHR